MSCDVEKDKVPYARQRLKSGLASLERDRKGVFIDVYKPSFKHIHDDTTP